MSRFNASRAGATLLWTALVCAPCSQAGADTAAGVGARDCAAFNFALEKNSDSALDAYVSWSLGFIAGFNWSNVRGHDVNVDAAGLINWLGQYCAANPDAGVYVALQELIRLNIR